MGFTRTRPRKTPVKRDEARAQNFKENFKILYNCFEVWFYDETGMVADAKPPLVWSRKGHRQVLYYGGAHIRESVLGAVNPRTGCFESLIMPYTNTEIFQDFLDYFNERLDGRFVLMAMDNASWHKSKSLNWGTVMPIFLPPYSPDLNPIEILWKVMKDRMYSAFPAKNHDELQERIQKEIRYFINNPEEVKSICKVSY